MLILILYYPAELHVSISSEDKKRKAGSSISMTDCNSVCGLLQTVGNTCTHMQSCLLAVDVHIHHCGFRDSSEGDTASPRVEKQLLPLLK